MSATLRPEEAIRRYVEDHGGQVDVHVETLASVWQLPEARDGDWSSVGAALFAVGLRVRPSRDEGESNGLLSLETVDPASVTTVGERTGEANRFGRARPDRLGGPPLEAPLAHNLRLLWRSAWLIILCVLAAGGIAAALSFTRPPEYRAEMKLVVGQGGGILEPGFGNSPEPFTQTIGNLLESGIVAQRVVNALGLRMRPEALLKHLRVTSRPESTVLEVTYDSTDRVQAVAVLETLARVFPNLLQTRLGGVVTTSQSGERRPVSATVFDPPRLEPRPVAPRPVRNIGIAVGLGLLVGIGLAVVRDALSRRDYGPGR